MNNALIENQEEELDRTPWLRARQDELITLIKAVDELINSRPWQTLSSMVFDGVTEMLEKKLTSEAKKNDPNTLELARINGQLVWARKYSDLKELRKAFETEMEGIKKQLIVH